MYPFIWNREKLPQHVWQVQQSKYETEYLIRLFVPFVTFTILTTGMKEFSLRCLFFLPRTRFLLYLLIVFQIKTSHFTWMNFYQVLLRINSCHMILMLIHTTTATVSSKQICVIFSLTSSLDYPQSTPPTLEDWHSFASLGEAAH